MARQAPVDPLELVRAVIAALDRSPCPLPPAGVRRALVGPFRVPVARLREVLLDLAQQGKLHRRPSGRTESYWTRNVEEEARASLLRHLANGPRGRSDLTQAIRAEFPILAPKDVAHLLEGLTSEDAVFAHPPLRGSQPSYATTPPDLAPFLTRLVAELDRCSSRLGRYGIDRATIVRAAAARLGAALAPGVPTSGSARASGDLAGDLLAVLAIVARRAPASIPELRRLFLRPKREFDDAVLRLQAQRRVILHRHDLPASLTDEQRYEFVTSADGTCYVGVGLAGGGPP